LTGILLKLRFKALKQCESIRRGSGKARNDLALAQSANFPGIRLHHGLAKADLTIATDHDTITLPNHQDRRRAPSLLVIAHVSVQILFRFRYVFDQT
jgi:hypothetical protein